MVNEESILIQLTWRNGAGNDTVINVFGRRSESAFDQLVIALTDAGLLSMDAPAAHEAYALGGFAPFVLRPEDVRDGDRAVFLNIDPTWTLGDLERVLRSSSFVLRHSGTGPYEELYVLTLEDLLAFGGVVLDSVGAASIALGLARAFQRQRFRETRKLGRDWVRSGNTDLPPQLKNQLVLMESWRPGMLKVRFDLDDVGASAAMRTADFEYIDHVATWVRRDRISAWSTLPRTELD
ncbi:hypothetical protein [Microbacterium lacus]|uniref:Uncharacterized protein n=1 Tax=Microbacterium lacus TaxID=415217 RepID=A0ABN2FXM0_9MICO